MSHQATTWVMEFSRSRLSDRLVMLSIAHHISNDTGEAFPSVATIARESNISESQVHASLRKNRTTGELDFSVAASQYGTNIYRMPKFLDWHASIQRDAGRTRRETQRGANSAPLPSAKCAGAEQRMGTDSAPGGCRFEVQRERVKSAPELSVIKAVSGVAAPIDQAKYIEEHAVVTEKLERPDKPVFQISGLKEMPGADVPKRKQLLTTKGSDRYPGDPLRAGLWDGIHRKKIFNTFFDARSLSPRDQLRDCVRAAVTSLMENRKAKFLAARIEDENLEAAVLKKFPAEALCSLALISDFSRREDLTAEAILNAVVESAAERLRNPIQHPLFAMGNGA